MNHTISFRLDEDTFRRINTLSRHLVRSKSDILRRLILEEYIGRDLNSMDVDGIPSIAEREEFLRQFNKANQRCNNE